MNYFYKNRQIIERQKIYNSFNFTVTISAMHPTMYEYTAVLKKLFEKQTEVVQTKDFWEVSLSIIYLNKIFLKIN